MFANMFAKGVRYPSTMDLQEHIAHIERSQNEVRRFVAETRDPDSAPWPLLLTGMLVGAALFGAGMGFARLVGV